ncbi:MAG: helix-turn-helix domain-containing protein [Syntrophorhabdus aromaticivorans]|uniref:Helix-turn-helix domain-containing protein n=1 Tax=Syntrophorhabdus aromaticivorans TaxID=328301 RepID=A0A971M744_9BACT|nr:helix-turn-helix domain-containing protein [Syntrophorhabdus aromaticivorans]
MKTELEPQDIQAIAERVVQLLKPYLSGKEERQTGEIIFDVPMLCEYLHVTPKWIHERTHLKEIPFYKLSNKQLRFRKKDIDKWLESCKTASINDFRGKLKILK